MMFNCFLVVLVFVLIMAVGVFVQFYVFGFVGFSLFKDSDNVGVLICEFMIGDGVVVLAGMVLVSGMEIGWLIEFDNGFFFVGVYGYCFSEKLCGEFEIFYVSNDVDGYVDVIVGGGVLGGVDVAVLIIGLVLFGVMIVDFVVDGQGDVIMIVYVFNLYYDFDFDDVLLDFYVGVGVGLVDVFVDFFLFGVVIIDDSEIVFLFQLMFGVSFLLFDKIEVFGGYCYCMIGDVGIDVSLFLILLDIENNFYVLEVGICFYFQIFV